MKKIYNMKSAIVAVAAHMVGRKFNKFGSHRKKLFNCALKTASCEAGVYRIIAAGMIIKGWHLV